MRMLLKGGNVYDGQEMKVRDIIFTEEGIVSVGKEATLKDFDEAVNCMGLIVAPGLCDVHVHFREPGAGGGQAREPARPARRQGRGQRRNPGLGHGRGTGGRLLARRGPPP